MKRIIWLMALTSLILTLGGHLIGSTGPAASPSAAKGSQTKQDKEQETKERIRRDFERGRAVLEQKGVPFDAEELLEDDWRVKLQSKFALIPELQQDRHFGGRIKGALLANVLYLPERVELTGDTIIIANKLIFEGSDDMFIDSIALVV